MKKAKTNPDNMDQEREQLENEISVKKSNSFYVYMRRPEKNAACGDNSGLDDIFYDYY